MENSTSPNRSKDFKTQQQIPSTSMKEYLEHSILLNKKEQDETQHQTTVNQKSPQTYYKQFHDLVLIVLGLFILIFILNACFTYYNKTLMERVNQENTQETLKIIKGLEERLIQSLKKDQL